MHVYLREEPVEIELREVDAEGLIPEGADLVAVAFFVDGNEHPSFRAILPPETVAVLEEAAQIPVTLGLLAEEPEDSNTEVRAIVGLSVPVSGPFEGEELTTEEENSEPWRTGESGSPEAWRGEDAEAEEVPRTALLAFAPLVRLKRKFPDNFAEELADLLESALAGSTRPSLEARVDRMLEDL